MKIYVAPLPVPIKTDGLVILVDILRATSSITAALFHEAKIVKPLATVEEALVLKSEGFLVAGERKGLPPQGFDLGNSPREMSLALGEKVALTTTNGTKALTFVTQAKAIVAGSFLNLSSIVEFARRFAEVHILCAGTEGELALEDFLFAGKVCQALPQAKPANDAATVSREFALGVTNLEKTLLYSQHAQRLVHLGFEEDVRFCAQMDSHPVVPILTPEGFVALRGLVE